MAGSTFGKLFRVTTWGESHGKAIGAVLDGVPAGLPLNEEDIQFYLDRRRPGKNKYTTARAEADAVEILSGVFEGRTTGTPISMIVRNTDQRSRDYSEIASYYRPGHADYPFDAKYGFRDYRGGGRSSGRETIGRVCGGAVAAKILKELGMHVTAYVSSIGPISCDPAQFDETFLSESPVGMPDPIASRQAEEYLASCIERKDSAGGTVTVRVSGMLPGLGEPVFDKLDALLGRAYFSIGAVKAVEFGSGVAAGFSCGSENNDQYDPFTAKKQTNHAGGVLGGISDGSDLIARITFKPTPSIAQPQTALFRGGSVGEVVIKGRHDPVIMPRAAVVAECMTAMVLLDLALENMGAKMDGLKRFYAGH